MRGGVTGGDSCSQHKDRVGQVDEPGPKGVTSCLGNVTTAREGEQIGERRGEIPSYTPRDGGWGTRTSELARGLLCLFWFGR